MLFCEFDMLTYVVVSQVGLEMQISYSHITLFPLQNYNIWLSNNSVYLANYL